MEDIIVFNSTKKEHTTTLQHPFTSLCTIKYNCTWRWKYSWELSSRISGWSSVTILMASWKWPAWMVERMRILSSSWSRSMGGLMFASTENFSAASLKPSGNCTYGETVILNNEVVIPACDRSLWQWFIQERGWIYTINSLCELKDFYQKSIYMSKVSKFSRRTYCILLKISRKLWIFNINVYKFITSYIH